MRKLIITEFLLILSIGYGEESSIAFVNSDRIVQEYKALEEARQELDDLVKEWEDELQSSRRKLDSLRALFEKEKPSLSEEAKLTREREIKQKEREYSAFIESIWGKNGKLKQTTEKLIKPIMVKVEKTITQVAKDLGYSLVLDSSKDVVLYAQQKVDITNMVLEELNREYVGTTSPGEVPALRRIRIAVFPFREENPQIQATNYGETLLSSLLRGIGKSQKFKTYGTQEVWAKMEERGLTESKIIKNDVLAISQELLADAIVFGSLISKGNNILIQAELYDINGKVLYKTNKEVPPENENELIDAAYQIAQEIINYYPD